MATIRLLPLMAGTARLAPLHVQHGVTLAVRSGNEVLAVAVTAAVAGTQVDRMFEEGIGGEGDILHDMAPDAVTLYRKGDFAVVATAAGEPPLHVGHGYVGIPRTRLEQTVMAVPAL